jgi:hypothetical protein
MAGMGMAKPTLKGFGHPNGQTLNVLFFFFFFFLALQGWFSNSQTGLEPYLLFFFCQKAFFFKKKIKIKIKAFNFKKFLLFLVFNFYLGIRHVSTS